MTIRERSAGVKRDCVGLAGCPLKDFMQVLLRNSR